MQLAVIIINKNSDPMRVILNWLCVYGDKSNNPFQLFCMVRKKLTICLSVVNDLVLFLRLIRVLRIMT